MKVKKNIKPKKTIKNKKTHKIKLSKNPKLPEKNQKTIPTNNKLKDKEKNENLRLKYDLNKTNKIDDKLLEEGIHFLDKIRYKKSKSKYVSSYVKYIRGTKPISQKQIEAGMIIDMFYRKQIGEYQGKIILSKPLRYLILVLHPNFHGYMHALKITNINPKFFAKWINYIGWKEVNGKKLLIFKFKFPKANMTKEQAKRFYEKHIKKYIHSKFEDVYRTYKVGRVKNTYLVNFDLEKFSNDNGFKKVQKEHKENNNKRKIAENQKVTNKTKENKSDKNIKKK